MISRLKNLVVGNKYTAIELFKQDGNNKIAYLLCGKKNNELSILKSHYIDDFQEIKQKTSNQPLLLIINNDQVLQKDIQYFDIDDKKVLHRAFPNVQADDFYYEIVKTKNAAVVAISRKSYIDGLLKTLNGYTIAGISLGISSLAYIAGFNNYENVLTNTHSVTLNNDTVTIQQLEINEPEQNYIINGVEISNRYLLPFCGILKILLPNATTGNIDDLNTSLFKNFKQNAFFKKGLISAISILFILLSINFIFFFYYYDKVSEITEVESLNKFNIEKVLLLKREINNKEIKLKSFYETSNANNSWMINNITKKVPLTILLDELIYHPIEKKIKEHEEIITTNDVITITGITLSNNDFTKWIRELQTIKEIKDIIIVSFGKNDEGQTAFSIRIILRK